MKRALLLLLAGCSGAPPGSAAHPVDRALPDDVPPPPVAAPDELCRRLAIDLIGRIPTPAEADRCATEGVEVAVDSFLGMPEHEALERRLWGPLLGYDLEGQIYYRHLFDLDALVGEMVRGEISYDDFATQVITHPGFYATNPDDGWAARIFTAFLGRPPRRDEMDGLRPLTRIFVDRGVIEGGIYRLLREECESLTAEELELEGYESCEEYAIDNGGMDEWAVNLCDCAYSPAGCSTSALGGHADLGSAECGDDAEEAGTFTPGPSTAGQGDFVLEETDVEEEYVLVPATPIAGGGAGKRARLARLGAALTARIDFHEAAVDRELRRFLGWWQLGFRQPDFDLPAVRAVLADELRATGSLARVQRLIVTSRLYAAASDGSGDGPPWTAGPIRFLSGEAWVRSAATAVGEELGGCDHRLPFLRADDGDYVEYLLGETADDYDPGFPEPTVGSIGGDDEIAPFRSAAGRLGGCTRAPSPSEPNISLVTAQADLALELCAIGRDVIPDALAPDETGDAALDRMVGHLVPRTLSRSPSAEEAAELRADLRACLDAPDGCADAHVAARWLCARLIDSALFAAY